MSLIIKIFLQSLYLKRPKRKFSFKMYKKTQKSPANRSSPSNRSPPSTRDTSYQVNKPKIFSPFIPSHPTNIPLEHPFLLSLDKPHQTRPIIDMTIDIGNNSDRKLFIYENDDSGSLARQFCISNGLDLRCCDLIAQEIEKQINTYYDQKSKQINKSKPKFNKTPSKIQRTKHKSLHETNENPQDVKTKKKLRKAPSVKSFKEDSFSEDERSLSVNNRHYSKGKFNKLKEFPSQKDENQTCTFKPKINGPNSPFYEDNIGEKRYEKLYSKHKERINKHSKVVDEFINETCSFKPEINKKYKGNVAKGGISKVSDRLYEFQHVFERNRSERENFERNYDLKTGQKLFNPVIKKDKYYEMAKLKEKNEGEIKIIYSQSQINTTKGSKPMKNVLNIEKTNRSLEKPKKTIRNEVNIKKNNNVLMNKKEEWLLKELFNRLDTNGDGKIARNQLDFSKLEDELLEIIANLALEVLPAKDLIDFEGFVGILHKENLKNDVIKVSLKAFKEFKFY